MGREVPFGSSFMWGKDHMKTRKKQFHLFIKLMIKG
jgi:hypothetical protein